MPPTHRSFRHWTFRYLIDRARDRWYQTTHPDDPWLTPLSIQFLDFWLKPTDVGLEFGSGRSTAWFARRVKALSSVEHSQAWHNRVSQALNARGIHNVDYRLAIIQGDQNQANYVDVADNFEDGSLDFILVDGLCRDICATSTLTKLRRGGIMIIDDVHRYLPSESISPYARTQTQGPASPLWGHFLTDVKAWRCLWTSKGVSDTALYIKP